MGSLRNGTKSELNREEDEQEPILKEQNQRFCMFPIRYKELWEMYKKAEASFWTEGTQIFFERRVGDYQKASVMSSLRDGGKNYVFKMDEDF